MRKRGAGSVWMILPLYLFTLIFVALPLLYVIALSFFTADGGYGVNWKFTLDNYKQILEPVYLQTFTGSFRLAITSTLIICLIGYPFGYFMAKLSEGKKKLAMLFLMLPFWVNSLIRLYGWIIILQKKGLLNYIFGIMNDDPYADNDLAELKKFLGSKVRVNCALQDCSLRDIAAMPQAELNICFGYGELLAQKMQEKFGVPYIKCAYPYGVAGMQKFLRQLGAALKVDFAEELSELEAAAEKLVYRSADYLVNLYQMPVALATDKAHLAGLQSFFAEELGMHVVIAEDTAEFSLDKMAEAAAKHKPVLFCGSSFLKNLAEKYQVPLVRCAYPAFDRLCFTDNTLVGARGAALLIEQIVNSALQQQYKTDGRYAGLRESICEVNHE